MVKGFTARNSNENPPDMLSSANAPAKLAAFCWIIRPVIDHKIDEFDELKMIILIVLRN